MPKLFMSMFSLEDLRNDFLAKCKSLKLFHEKSTPHEGFTIKPH